MTIKQEILAEAYFLNFGKPEEQKAALDALIFLTNVLQHTTLNEETERKQSCTSQH
jgi:hypothetical protein